MRRELSVDLKGAGSEIEIIVRFAEKLGLSNGGLGWNINSIPNWNAFVDDIRDLSSVGVQNGDEVILSISGIYELKDKGLRTSSGVAMVPFLSELLLEITDSTIGPDTFKLFPQFKS
ncbi:MAG: hypothetical protein EPN84_13550 [Legionella sp.]|nr:MAG: hypothetical protein EPN84_13550 [Legionella sp.]